jgi:hypothetical protein
MEPEAGLSQRRGFTTEEEMKESLPNEFMLTQGDAIDILAAKSRVFKEPLCLCTAINIYRSFL